MDPLERTLMTIGCRDCDALPKAPDAGRIVATPDGPVQIMHNGVKVVAGGYHGDWMAHIIRALRGHHEPQEELVFHHLLRYARHDTLMVELGAFWSYYSLWYLDEVPGSEAVCIEPDPHNLAVGRRNMELNGQNARMTFHQAAIGAPAADAVEMVCESDNATVVVPRLDMAGVLARVGGRAIEVLHIDAQGAELGFLQSMPAAVAAGLVRFLVVSTHHASISGSKTTHEDCLDAVRSMNGTIFAAHSIQESFSGDGLIVAGFFRQDTRIVMPPLSRNRPESSLFPES
jgi:FkbM family methyltransferase